MFTKHFWVAATERALKSGAQFVLLVILGGVGAEVAGNEPVNAFLLNYVTIAGVFVGGVVVSYLTSIVSAPINGDGPSLTKVEVVE